MKLVELTEFLVKSVAKDPSSVSVKGIDTEEELIIEVLVSEEDMGAVIGKSGSTIHAIRTIVRASAYANKEKKVKINIDSL